MEQISGSIIIPSYSYVCSCGNNLELFQGYSEPLPVQCPFCGEKENFHQDYQNNKSLGIVKGFDSCTTFGQVAEYNEKRLGKEQLQLRREADEEKRRNRKFKRLPKGAKVVKPTKEIPWWREGKVPGLKKMKKPLNLNKVKDTKDYIVTGNT